VNSLLGVLIIAVLGAGLTQMDVSEPKKRIITGAVIIGAAVVDYYRSRLGARR
jgi:ribose transport system permease protein